ncbi:N-acetyl-beta-glucosaminyl-glycoprotein 4-beta-N-acetylgalactosaminyltransferase 1-like isoform X1 [Ochotona princeps]|uniref:N-acetyl-beta-glucosaminyl-glycoprotein 4-beta-N-acetylgalactosaminyltransferase 1 isoform X1 n=1 Tax=Ochotona princeps TaxID=9978 RepID=UPI00271549F9|nr:N-acetyl-beta-glucosaminyl-glycoprotein 4-beta-N-acetylgalactosaminyltransferase 1 isoform X1 [Ochotona princeps]XP_058515613.1 N-acetyl-beta-glucosaminyl-glycoprotein 4-beta-N-acetylgalactosaminyltransferase 1-like isoform X1 [Ochotona princeps]
MPRFPVKKVRKQAKLLLLLLLLTGAAWLTFVHLSLARPGRAPRRRPGLPGDSERPVGVTEGRGVQAMLSTQQVEDSSESQEEEQGLEGQDPHALFPGGARRSLPMNLTHQVPPWREEYKGQVNLHVFEDWCGGAVGHLRRNLHFPLFPHIRTTVKKLAVSPKWKNYGLRIFGFLHPARDGDVQFSVASDDNSEFWLSVDESPAAAQLVAFVGKTGSEWTAPGEFTKFSSQVSKPRRLMASRRYYFELLHKQDDRGSDHVEVGWRAFLPGLKFEVIGSAHISLYTDESALKMDYVAHVPQSPASHVGGRAPPEEPSADMLRPDPRDTFFLTPRVEPATVENVLEPCAYAPTYVVKDFPIARYQGLQFVYLSFVYPNDHTRLTHMETENKCFYRESPLYLERFGFYKYMKMDKEEGEEEEVQRRAFLFLNPEDLLEEEGEGDLLDSAEPTEVAGFASPTPPSAPDELTPRRSRALSWATGAARPLPLFLGRAPPPRNTERQRPPAPPRVYVTRVRLGRHRSPGASALRGPPWPPFPGVFLRPRPLPRVRLRPPPRVPHPRGRRTGAPQTHAEPTVGAWEGQASSPGPPTPVASNWSSEPRPVTSFLSLSQATRLREGEEEEDDGEEAALGDSAEAAMGRTPGRWREAAIDWQRTFSVGAVDFELLRSDWNDLRCNVSGNLQLAEAEAVDVVAQYMERLNGHHGGRFALLRIVNVEKRRDSARGSRFLLELELQERGGGRRRLSEYVFLRLPGARSADADDAETQSPAPPAAASARPDGRPELCRPLRLSWRQDVTVHFIVPVKNQARWVAQFLADMAALQARTGDSHFSVVLVDFESDDMDVEKALRMARLPRYQYLRRTGNFERSAGLQAGVDAVEDPRSIVFLCDLHIHFPPSILDSIRKHCVEGKLAFAPVVMRLGCGSSPGNPRGYWEVNGFGLFGIYKSDFDRVGGMNTEEFRDQWGGEDWELLDRVLQAGLEVERLRLRHFYHHYHSKRGMWGARPGGP